MSTIVGSLAIELGLDTAQLEAGLKKIPGMATQSLNPLSSEAKRVSREGAESLRLFDEALGVHISRPITKILSNDFPALAKGLQSLLGAGVVLGIGIAVFDVIEKGIERVGKAIDDAKKKQEEWITSTHNLAMALNDENVKIANGFDEITAKLDELSGDKYGALAANLRIIGRNDDAEAVSALDNITKAYMENAKAAIAAASAANQFWLAVGRLTTSPLEQQTEKLRLGADEIKNKFDEITSSHGLAKGAAYLNDELTKQKAILASMQGQVLSGFDTFLAKATFLDNYVSRHGAITKETATQQQAIVNMLQKEVDFATQLQALDTGKKKVATKETEESRDIGEKQLTKLRSETEGLLAQAAATTKSVAEQKLAQAAAEASTIIMGIEEAAHGRLTQKVQEELAAVHALTAEKLIAKDTVATNDSLQKQLDTLHEQTIAANDLAAAYAKGGAAVLDAEVEQKLAAQVAEVKQLHAEYDAARAAAAAYAAQANTFGPKQGLNIPALDLDKLKAGVDAADAKLAELKIQQVIADQAKYQEELNKTSEALAGEQPYLDALNAAYGKNEIAVRNAQVALTLYHWEQAHPGATPDQISQENQLLTQQAIDAQRAADAKAAASYSVQTMYQNEIDKLQRIKEIIVANGDSTVLIDAKIMDAQDALIHQWDEAALKVGTFQEKFDAVMNEVQVKGVEAAHAMGQAWMTAIDGVNANLGKLLTGQKTDFAKTIQTLAQKQTETQLAKVEGEIAGHWGIKIPETGKPDGTASNPLHVAVVSGATHGAPGAAGPPGALPTGFGLGGPTRTSPGLLMARELLGAPAGTSGTQPDGSQGSPFYTVTSNPTGNPVGASAGVTPAVAAAAATTSPAGTPGAPGSPGASTFSSTLISTLAAFGGALATGGPTTPGKAYLVGERGPEVFKPDSAGTVIPTYTEPSFAQGNTNFTFGPQDRDWGTYQAYLRRTHQGPDHSSLFESLGTFGGGLLLKALTGGFKTPTPVPAAEGQVAAQLPVTGGSLADLNAITDSTAASASTAANFPIPAMANGGPVSSGTTYLVGERGKELFKPITQLFSKIFHHPVTGGVSPSTPLDAGARRDLDALTNGQAPAPKVSVMPVLPSGTKPGDVDYTYYQNWAKEYTPAAPLAPPGPQSPTPPSLSVQNATDEAIHPHFLNIPAFKGTAGFTLDGFRATGGDVKSGGMYMVGERGPELFSPREHGEIIPNHRVDAYMADGGDVFAGNTYMVSERGPEAFRSSSSVVTNNNQRGGDTYHNTINFNNSGGSNDLFQRPQRHEMDRMFARMQKGPRQ